MSNQIDVYWAPESGGFNNSQQDWNILYKTPVPLIKYLSNFEIDDRENNFFKCPASTNFMKKIFVIENPIKSSYIFKNKEIVPSSETSLVSQIIHGPTIKNNLLFFYGLSFYIFSEEEIEATLTSPFFSQALHMKYGSLVPGTVNIGSWFRSINTEFNLWENINEFSIEEGEPVAYLIFNSDKKINLKRFYMNETLQKIARTNSSSSSWEKRVPLIKRYKRFKESKTKEIVLKEIRKNIL